MPSSGFFNILTKTIFNSTTSVIGAGDCSRIPQQKFFGKID